MKHELARNHNINTLARAHRQTSRNAYNTMYKTQLQMNLLWGERVRTHYNQIPEARWIWHIRNGKLNSPNAYERIYCLHTAYVNKLY